MGNRKESTVPKNLTQIISTFFPTVKYIKITLKIAQLNDHCVPGMKFNRTTV